MGIVYNVGRIELSVMREIIDCTSLRNDIILLNDLDVKKMDSPYSMYFDESGNTRCFWIKDGEYNVDPFTHFVLGGIVANKAVDFEYAKKRIGCNVTVQEIKSKNVYKGDFETCLKSTKLKNFLDLIVEQGWLVHFSAVELFYYAIVDIVDSVMEVDIDNYQIKNELYRILRHDISMTQHILVQYEYPNVSDDNKNDFLDSCIKVLDNNIVNTGRANEFTYKLRIGFQLAQEKKELPFIQDENTGSLLHNFFSFYMRPIYMFKNSLLFFDEELSIQEQLKSYSLLLDGATLENYQFINSKENVMVQLSDVMMGIIARYLRFVNTNNSIDEAVSKFDANQIASLYQLNNILNFSASSNPAFWDLFLCYDMRSRFSYIVGKYR